MKDAEKPAEPIKIEVVDQEAKLKIDTDNVSVMVEELSIKSEDDYAIAQMLGKAANEVIKKVKSYFKPIKESTQKAHKDAVALEKKFLKSPEESKAKLKELMIAFEDEQEKIRLAKEKVIQDRLKAQAEEELEKNLDAGVEPDDAVAEVLIPEDIHVQSTFKTVGSTTDNWKAEVTDFKKFLMAVVASGQIDLLEANQKALNTYAKSTEGKKPLAGVKFVNNKVKKF